MKNFVSLKINKKQFVSQFDEIYKTIEAACKMERLSTFQPNLKLEWISEIDLGCDEFYPDFDPKAPSDFPFALDEEQFRAFVANIITQIQKYL